MLVQDYRIKFSSAFQQGVRAHRMSTVTGSLKGCEIMERNFSQKSSKGISPEEAYISTSFHIRDEKYP